MSSFEEAVLMWCEDGHTWIDQGDGTVSPSWGYGGTHMPVDDATRCPEPRINAAGEYWCADCGEWKRSLRDCISGAFLHAMGTPGLVPDATAVMSQASR
jgi:hypothetical protein